MVLKSAYLYKRVPWLGVPKMADVDQAFYRETKTHRGRCEHSLTVAKVGAEPVPVLSLLIRAKPPLSLSSHRNFRISLCPGIP